MSCAVWVLGQVERRGCVVCALCQVERRECAVFVLGQVERHRVGSGGKTSWCHVLCGCSVR